MPSSDKARRVGRKDPANASSWQYPVPREYQDLLPCDQDDDSDGGDDGRLPPGSREWNRDFWKAARRVAKRRVQDLAPDLGDVHRRLAHFHDSLWVEELGVTLHLHSMRLTADELSSVGNGLFALDVAGLGEGTVGPMHENGILRSVRILIKCGKGTAHWATPQPSAGKGVLLVSALPSLAESRGPFSVEFHPHRFQQLALHRALDSPRTESILQASTLKDGDSVQPAAVDHHGKELAQALPPSLNEDQRRAIVAALQPGARHPIVVWGPPGTGKSTLAAFIVWHLVQQQPIGLHILVAAPSNTAADVLCTKLAKLGLDTGAMLRLNALGRNVNTVPEAIRGYCSYKTAENGQLAFTIPPLQQVRRFKVVVTTCVCASHLSNALRVAGSQESWFSHVVVDEAGEATEPETLVPLALLRPVAGRVVLLGDHFQLGPLVVAPLAMRLGGLHISMMERLVNERFDAARSRELQGSLSRDALLECEDHGLFFLTESYRSHPAIMALYSDIFYAGKLEHRQRPQQFGLLGFFEAHGLGDPVLMHHVVGMEQRDPGNASIYNTAEVLAVQRYVVDLLQSSSFGLEPQDICVITPYTRQVQALERQFESLGAAFAGVECGTVERFQGQERRVVIISAVRCSRAGGRAQDDAARRPIGFLADPRRLNVAVSRAVAGLIVVGDLKTLAKHSAQWLQLVQMAREMGSLRGEPLDHGEAAPRDVGTLQAVPAKKAEVAWEALTGA